MLVFVFAKLETFPASSATTVILSFVILILTPSIAPSADAATPPVFEVG